MGAYYIHRGGVLLQTGHCPDGHEAAHAREGCVLELGEPPSHITYPTPPAPTYAQLRAAAYPSLADQLDAIWKGGQAMETMRAKVLEVKQRFPKPSDSGSIST